MEYAHPNKDMLNELTSLYWYWYFPYRMLYGNSPEVDAEYERRKADIRVKYATHRS